MILDHVGFHVTDLPKSREFFVRALQPLGIAVASEGDGWAFLGKNGKGQFWIDSFGPSQGPIHIAFAAETRVQVRKFYDAALAAGGADNGAPGLRPQYHADYYGAFVTGPDGHNVEAVCHAAQA